MEKKQTLWTRGFIMVFLMSLFSGMAAYMTYPLVTQYALTIKDDIALASSISGLMSLSSLFICPFAGMITDSFDLKKILQFSSVFYTLILIAHSLAVTIPLLVLMRLLTGISFSINSVTGTVFSTRFIPRKRMAEGLGYAALANILAQAAGPGVGLYLAESFGYHVTFICAAGAAFLSFVIVCLLPYKEERQIVPDFRKISVNDLIAFEYCDFLLLAALFSVGNSFATTFLALVGKERGIANIGLFFTIYSLAMVFLRPAVGTLHDRKGIYVVMVPAILCAAAGVYLIGIGKTLFVMLLASVFKAIGQGAGTPALQTEVIKRMDDSRSGVAASTVLIGMHIGNAFGPMLGGIFVENFGYEKMFVGFAIISAILCFLLLGIRYLADRKDKYSI